MQSVYNTLLRATDSCFDSVIPRLIAISILIAMLTSKLTAREVYQSPNVILVRVGRFQTTYVFHACRPCLF
jgi:hypothetical protein